MWHSWLNAFLYVFFRANLHVLLEPVQHKLPVFEVLRGFGGADVPRTRGAHELYGNMPHHFERHVKLFGLFDGTAQVVLRMHKERGGRHLAGMAERRTLVIVGDALALPGIAARLSGLPETDVRSSDKRNEIGDASHRYCRLETICLADNI